MSSAGQAGSVKPGVIRAHLAQLRVIPGQPQINTLSMLSAIAAARRAGADLVVFPELAVSGCLLGDAWERDAFLRECEACGERIREAAEGLVVVFGNVAMDWARRDAESRVRKFNALFVAEERRFIGPRAGPLPFGVEIHRSSGGDFDADCHFHGLCALARETGRRVEDFIAPVMTRRWSLGCVVGADVWDADGTLAPLRRLAEQGADLLIGINNAPYAFNCGRRRRVSLAAQAAALRKPLVYVSNVGLQNDGKTVFACDGSSGVYSGAGGQVVLPAFEEGGLSQAIPLDGAAFGPPVELRDDGPAELCRALLSGIREFMVQGGIQRAVVGVSGGIDSAVVAALFSRVLPPEQLLLAILPGPFTSATTVVLARRLAEALGCYAVELPIADSVALTRSRIDGLEIAARRGERRARLRLTDFMMENVQARDRSARVLAALAAAFGGVFTCNANKAEATVGYTTLYGDLAGFLAPIADLWKGEVYQLGRYLNAQVFQREAIPEGSFTVAPSAELSPAQNVDQGKGDPLIYPYHDRLFAAWVEGGPRASPEEILDWYRAGRLEQQLGYAGKIAALFPEPRAFVADLERWWRQYQGLGVAKRIQAPPVLAVKRRAPGCSRREAQLTPWFSLRYQELKAQILPGRAEAG